MTESELRKLDLEIAKLIAETMKLNKEIRWYEVMVIVAVTLAVVAVAKVAL